MKFDTDRIRCERCYGSGITGAYAHADTEDSVETIRCDQCDGFGFVSRIVISEQLEPINAWIFDDNQTVLVCENRPFNSLRYRPVLIVDRPQPTVPSPTN